MNTCFLYTDLLQLPGQLLHLPLHPLQPLHPPSLRVLSMERTAVSSAAARMLRTMISPITVASLINYI